MLQLQSLLGIAAFIGMAYLCSNNKKKIPWKMVGIGLVMQALFAILMLGIPSLNFETPLQDFFFFANRAILKLIQFSEVGSGFIFGDLIKPQKTGFILAFQVLPIIIFLSSTMTVLYYLGVMQWIVNFFAFVMQKFLKLSGAESLAAAANVFIGQTEAPLVVKPYLKNMTPSELFSLMVGGMATIAGSVMAAYVGMLKDDIPNIGGHLITASLLSAPAALVIAKIMVPETRTPETMGRIPKEKEKPFVNVIEAAAVGASDGLKLAANVGAMLLAFVAIIAMLDGLIVSLSQGAYLLSDLLFSTQLQGQTPISLSRIFGWLFMPVGFLLGIPAVDLQISGTLIGKKIVFNEFIAYMDLAKMISQLQPRSAIILSYALCGFANFSSIAIIIGGIGPLIPDRKKELAQFGIRAVIGGSLAAFITACLASLLIA